jgi:hypothetical protein
MRVAKLDPPHHIAGAGVATLCSFGRLLMFNTNTVYYSITLAIRRKAYQTVCFLNLGLLSRRVGTRAVSINHMEPNTRKNDAVP